MQFSLGLAAGGFLERVGSCKEKILELAGAALSMEKIVEGFSSAIERGDSLKHLSDQTGQSVTTLYGLQQAFKTVGLSADELPDVILRMNQALSGLGRGGNALPLLARLGLDPSQLKTMDTAKEISAISNALSKLDKQSAIGVSSQLFGMETGAKPFLQIVGSIKEFNDSLRQTKSEGAVFAQLAPLAADLDAGFIRMKGHIEAAFAGVLNGFGPILLKGEAFIEGLTKKISNFGLQASSALVKAFDTGKISQLLDLTFGASVEFLSNAIMNILGSSSFWKGIWDVAVGSFISGFSGAWIAFASMGEAILAGLDTGFQKILEEIGKTKLGSLMGIGGYKAQSFDQNFAWEKAKGQDGMDALKSFMPTGGSFFKAGMGEMSGAVTKAFAQSGGILQDQLKHFWNGLTSNKKNTPDSTDQFASKGSQSVDNEKYTYRREATGLEKMGFVGGGNSMSDSARRTADNTNTMVSLLQQTVNLLGSPSSITNAI